MKVIKKNTVPKEPRKAPLFTGPVSMQSFVSPDLSKRFMISEVHFETGVRNKFHKHTIEQVLRQRAAMTHLLGDELAPIAERWGLAIAAVEVRSAQVLSKQLFENMQAKYRDTQRLKSARSAMETEEAIARARATDRECSRPGRQENVA